MTTKSQATKVKVNSLVFIKLKTSVNQINKTIITTWPSNSTSRLYPKELEASSQRNVCTLMSITAFFTIAKRWRYHPLTNRWMLWVQEQNKYAVLCYAKSFQSCPTLCDPIDGSPPGSPVPEILQARTLEWVAISSPIHESEKWRWSRLVVSDS